MLRDLLSPMLLTAKVFYHFQLNGGEGGMNPDLLFYILFFYFFFHQRVYWSIHTDECLHERVFRSLKGGGCIFFYIQKGSDRDKEDPPSFLFSFLIPFSLCRGGLLCISVTCLGRRRGYRRGRN